jgi:hypothetical protein
VRKTRVDEAFIPLALLVLIRELHRKAVHAWLGAQSEQLR